MRRQTVLEQTARVLNSAISQQYICKRCIAQARSRAMHTSFPRLADEPLWKQLQNRMFGKKEDEMAAESRARLQEERLKRHEAGDLIQSDKIVIDGVEHETAPYIEYRTNQTYVASDNEEGLEHVGSDAWVKRQADTGEQYTRQVMWCYVECLLTLTSLIPKARRRIRPDDAQWRALLRHALIEVLTMTKHGQPLEKFNSAHPAAAVQITKGVKLAFNPSAGTVHLQFADAEHEQALLDHCMLPAETTKSKPQRLEDILNQFDLAGTSTEQTQLRPAWMKIPLTSTHLRLAVCLRPCSGALLIHC